MRKIDYIVKCPSAPFENENCRQDLNRAYLICNDLSDEYGYAEIVWYDDQGHQHLYADYGSKVT